MFDSNLQTWNSKSKHNGKKKFTDQSLQACQKKRITDRDDLTETVPRRHNGDDVAYTIGIACVEYNPVGGGVVWTVTSVLIKATRGLWEVEKQWVVFSV